MDFPVPPIGQVDLTRVLRALADPQRRAVIGELAADLRDSERPCASFPIPGTKSTRTHHWRVLREAGLSCNATPATGPSSSCAAPSSSSASPDCSTPSPGSRRTANNRPPAHTGR